MGGSTVQQKIQKLNVLTDHNPSSFGFWGVAKNVSHKYSWDSQKALANNIPFKVTELIQQQKNQPICYYGKRPLWSLCLVLVHQVGSRWQFCRSVWHELKTFPYCLVHHLPQIKKKGKWQVRVADLVSLLYITILKTYMIDHFVSNKSCTGVERADAEWINRYNICVSILGDLRRGYITCQHVQSNRKTNWVFVASPCERAAAVGAFLGAEDTKEQNSQRFLAKNKSGFMIK